VNEREEEKKSETEQCEKLPSGVGILTASATATEEF
jgi:hypothetical protein